MPVPRTAAVLILAVLGLGMVIGGLGGSAGSTLASTRPVIVVRTPPPSPSPTPAEHHSARAKPRAHHSAPV
jgi:hypothetical protein